MSSNSIPLLPGVELLESMRSVGYSFDAAVADIIDNSITANSTSVRIQADITNGKYVYILDNGCGMDENAALEALRLAGTATKARNDSADLGRFGLGLKTSSLSQASRLTLITKRDGKTVAFCWDINHVLKTHEWEILCLSESEYKKLPGYELLEDQITGTLVLWEDLDYLLGNTTDKATHLSSKIKSLKEHLALVFHRFIDGEKHLKIFVNADSPLGAIDPFLGQHPKTQITPTQEFFIEGSKVIVEGYTIPHQKHLSLKLRERFDLGENMRDFQGFYIYRNERLISWGQWFGLTRKEELNKQSRIKVEITSALDGLWQIDIRKSRSEPPYEFKKQLRPLMESIVATSKKVHTFRGRRARTEEISHYWNIYKKDKQVRYEINSEHPEISSLMQNMSSADRANFKKLLKDIPTFMPYRDIYVETAKNTAVLASQISDGDFVERILNLQNIGFINGSPREMAQKLASIEPFSTIAPREKLLELTEQAIVTKDRK